jgi:hypothetical protein
MNEDRTCDSSRSKSAQSGSGPVRCYLAVDKRGKVRGRYRFARLAILEASENGWELEMEGCE